MSEGSLPLPMELHIDAVCQKFEAAWQATGADRARPRIEDYLATVDAAARRPLLCELLRVELHYRRAERPSADEYRRRFPEHAHLLGPLFEPRPESAADGGDTSDSVVQPGAGEAPRSTGPEPPPVQPAGVSPPAVPGYEILGRLGEGGMGVVYKARHLRLDKVVALKVLPARAQDSPERVARFLREMKAIGSLDHPNVVEAHDAGVAAGTVYLVMKFIDGTDLARLVRQRGPLPVAEACDLARQAALGLEYLHGRRLVHRDLKPSNLMRTPDGALKILDLGLARWRTEAASDDDLTGTGQVLGTADYLAPEQVRRAAVDGRADLYGLGGTLFYLLTGRAPFAHHPGSFEKLEAHCTEAPPDVRALRPEVPAALAELVGRLLAKRPEDRPQTPGEVRDRLRALGPAPGDNERPEFEALPRAGTSAPPAPADTEGDPGFDLPEVWVEQQSHLRGFIGREAVLAAVAAWIDARAPGGYLLLLGPPGQGKSALMAELARREQARGGCLLHMVKSHRDPRRFLPALIGQASRLARTRFGEAAYRGDLEDLRNALARAVEAVRARTGRAVLVLDALDELAGREEPRSLEFLPPAVPEGVRVVLTCRPDVPLVQALRSRLTGLEERPVPPLTEADFRNLLAARVGAPALRLLEDTVDLAAVFARLGGNPLFLRAAVDRIAAEVGQADREGRAPRVEVGELPASYAAFFREVYNRLGERAGTRWTSAEGRHKARLLQLLCVAREPLGYEELAGLMAAQGEALPPEDCRDRLDEMSPYLLDTGGGRYQPWHQGLTDYVRQEVLGGAGVRQVEETFCRWPAAAGPAPYGLRHRLGHLLAAGQVGEAAGLLTDLAFLEAKAEAGLVFELAADFGLAAAGLRGHPSGHLLRLVEEALRRDLHFLGRHPGCLFQCLWNNGWWHDCPQAAIHYEEGQAPGAAQGVGLHRLLERWRQEKERRQPGFVWLRSLRPPLMHLGTALRAVFRGHESEVNSVCYSTDGRRLASADDDGTVRVWDAASGAELLCLRGHENSVPSVAFAPDGRTLAGGCYDGTVRVWDAASGAALLCLRGHGGGVSSVAFAPDGRTLASSSSDKTVRVWDAASGAELLCLRGHEYSVRSVTFSPDGRALASGADDGTVRVWDAASGAELLCLRGHERSVWSVAFATAGRTLASGSWDKTARVWDAASGTERLCLRGHEDWVRSVAFAADGRTLASGSDDGTVRLWDAASGAALLCLRGHGGIVSSVAFAADGRTLASGSWDKTARVWDASSGTAPLRLCGHEHLVRSVAFAPDGRTLASGSDDGTLRLWDAASGTERLCLRGHGGIVSSVAFAADGRTLASGSGDRTVRVWDAASGTALLCLRGHGDWVRNVAFAADGRTLASGSWDKTVRVWDATSGTALLRLCGHEHLVRSVAFAADGRTLASSSRDGTVRVWDTASGACLQVIPRTMDIRAITGITARSPWRAVTRRLETVVEVTATRQAIAWFPLAVEQIVPHPSGRTWAGGVGAYVCLFTLEGNLQAP
jgi:WD40 repeat protein/serine/threonine protein kinase